LKAASRSKRKFPEFPLRFLWIKLGVAVAAGENSLQNSVWLQRIFIGRALMLFWFVSIAHAEVASVYGGRDGYCGSRTANGARANCSAMTAVHR
jgi:hypothetical protein